MAKLKQSEQQADGMTPMIDIVFLLLIFFLLMPFRAPNKRLDSFLPKEGPGSGPGPQDTIRLEIRQRPEAQGQAYYKVQMKKVRDGERLYRVLLDQANNDTTVPVVLDADVDVEYQYVLNALDQCYKAEMKSVKFSAPPSPEARRLDYMETRRVRDARGISVYGSH